MRSRNQDGLETKAKDPERSVVTGGTADPHSGNILPNAILGPLL